ncbi:uncharacterized protein K02A2.6-like [Paramacrobiotus metropolitanus]|uniref:uncharacterized protein K02A2.6-like n=1 Tax=Paramacrobiotus metropolitanus TaxID=2943436 RepID=UPI0024459C34|nr:uncharacterized protein K02A2.6-like [Paramacrobiotus metropolitanus]
MSTFRFRRRRGWRNAFLYVFAGNPDDFTTAQIVDKLEHAFVKKTNVATEWANYFKLKQEQGESLLDYSNKLRRKAFPCGFPADVLEKNMSATFLNGLASDAVREHPQSKTYSTLEEALDIAEKYELRRSTRKGQTTVDVARVESGKRNPAGNGYRRRDGARGGQRGRDLGGARKPAGAEGGKGAACDGCGSTQHAQSDCWAKDAECRKCKKRGHIAKVCRSAQSSSGRQGRDGRRTFLVEEEYEVLSVDATSGRANHVPVKINAVPVSPVLDTGSGVTIVASETWRSIGSPKLSPYTNPLKIFTGHTLKVIGTAMVEVAHARTRKTLPVIVVATRGNVPGRDWIHALNLSQLSLRDLQIPAVCAVSGNVQLKQIFAKHSAVFREELGQCKHYKAHLHLKPSATPVFRKARPVPFAFREAVGRDIDRLVEKGILSPVEHAKWAAPIVAALKRAEDIRTCADLSTGLNDALDVQQYPLPTPDELFAKLNGGQKFSTLDLAEAYAQVELDEESKALVVINTHFQYNRMPFGVASGPSIFQQIMERILQGCEGVAIYMDDIIVTGATDEEHLRNLERVLQRLEEYGLRLKRSKCQFLQDSVEYLGFVVDSRGRHISRDQVKALLDMDRPANVSQLRAFLGLVNHYGKYVRDLSTKCCPFHQLLKAGV